MSDWADGLPDVFLVDRLEEAMPVTVAAPRGYACDHVSVTSVPGTIRSIEPHCGCDPQPILP